MTPADDRILVQLRAVLERMLWYEGSHSSVRRYLSSSSRQALWKRISSPSFSSNEKSVSKSWPGGGFEAIASARASIKIER